MMFGPTFLRGHVSMLGKGEGLNLFLTNQMTTYFNKLFNWLLEKALQRTLWAGLNR